MNDVVGGADVGGDLPSVTRLALGVDGRYLFVATPKGVNRAALVE